MSQSTNIVGYIITVCVYKCLVVEYNYFMSNYVKGFFLVFLMEMKSQHFFGDI